MFLTEFMRACELKDRAAIAQLIESIPAKCWVYPCGHAEAWYESVGIAAQRLSGGSGINTYETVSVTVLRPDDNTSFAGQYSADELHLPNYIPRWQRVS